MPQVSRAFEETYTHYLDRIAEIDLPARAARLGAKTHANGIVISFFNRPCIVGPQGITGPSGRRPSFDTCIVLFKYILLCPDIEPVGSDWMSFRDFKDSGPLTKYFAHDVERVVAEYFAGRRKRLVRAGERLGGRPPDIEVSYDVGLRFDPLAHISMLLLFNDRDEEFPAQCSVLFEQNAEAYLDAECLAILGSMLAGRLKQAAAESTVPKA